MTAPWSAVGASVTGSGHGEIGCQDAHRVEVLPDALVIAVADGAGSAPLSATGAALAARRAVSAALEHLILASTPEQVVTSALLSARHALDDAAVRRGCSVSDLATTLLVAVLSDGVLATAQVGDGAVVALTGDGLELVDGVDRGEYLNETTFLSSGSWHQASRISVRDASDVTALAVMSDGLQSLALDLGTDEPFAGFFEPLWTWMRSVDGPVEAHRELTRFLGSERVQSRTDDDITLVVATSAPVPATV